jgi:dipeptidyl aminopeptidase/acylaminoacyl peptidase
LLLPAGCEAGRCYPLIVSIYPGSGQGNGYEDAKHVNRFGLVAAFGMFNMQLYETRGYAMFYPSAPVRMGTGMRDMADAILPANDEVIAQGIADPWRLGIMGGAMPA